MNICAVTVTFNRLDKLKKTLDAFSNLVSFPDAIIVVNNASTDDTADYLEQWKVKKEPFSKIVVNLKENTGGSGGFNAGIKKALEIGCDWILIGDDDAYIDQNTVKHFEERPEVNDKEIGAIACQVDSPDGIMFGHRRTINKGFISIHEIDSTKDDYYKDSFYIDLFSFVGVFLKAEFVKLIGLPRKDFFIWYDDTEYSSRLSNIAKVVCIPDLKIYHDCHFEDIRFCWKSYYGYRNKLVTLKSIYGKRYCYAFLFALKMSTLLDLIKGNKMKAATKNTAIADFKMNKMGKNETFMPGVFKFK